MYPDCYQQKRRETGYTEYCHQNIRCFSYIRIAHAGVKLNQTFDFCHNFTSNRATFSAGASTSIKL